MMFRTQRIMRRRSPAAWPRARRRPGPPASGCAERTASIIRLAARPSALSGAMSTTCCQIDAAPVRSCLPKARTTPMFSMVLVCFGSICSERSNCASARSAWLA